MERGVLAAASPLRGLAAASARGRRPPKAGGGPKKYYPLALRNSFVPTSHLSATLLEGLVVLLSAQVASHYPNGGRWLGKVR